MPTPKQDADFLVAQRMGLLNNAPNRLMQSSGVAMLCGRGRWSPPSAHLDGLVVAGRYDEVVVARRRVQAPRVRPGPGVQRAVARRHHAVLLRRSQLCARTHRAAQHDMFERIFTAVCPTFKEGLQHLTLSTPPWLGALTGPPSYHY